MFTLIYILSGVLCFAVGVMLAWHLWSIMSGETSVESHDHEVYRKVAKERGQVCFTPFIICHVILNAIIGVRELVRLRVGFPSQLLPFAHGYITIGN